MRFRFHKGECAVVLTHKRFLLMAALVAIVAMVVAACGGSDPTAAPAPTKAAPAKAAATATPVSVASTATSGPRPMPEL